jgi:hypothetical protein
MKPRPTFEKRRKEHARKDKKKEKEEKRVQRKGEKSDKPEGDGEDPDLANIVWGPQPGIVDEDGYVKG